MTPDAPYPIDNGARFMVRDTVPSWAELASGLEALRALCPPHCYPLRCSAQKSSRGARVHLLMVYQVKGRAHE